MNQIWVEWYSRAVDDMESADILLSAYPPKVEIACFHCQQSAEKALKAYLASRNADISKTHDLSLLCKQCGEQDARFLILSDQCAELAIYGVSVRYPNDLGLELSDAQRALQQSRDVLAFVKGYLGTQSADCP